MTVVAYPPHWVPNDLIFYTAERFLEKYRIGRIVYRGEEASATTTGT